VEFKVYTGCLGSVLPADSGITVALDNPPPGASSRPSATVSLGDWPTLIYSTSQLTLHSVDVVRMTSR